MSGLRFTRPFTILGIVLALVVITAFVLVALNAQNSAASPSLNVVVANRDLQPEDYISVIATVASAGKVASKTSFTNLHVIRVGAPAAPGATTSNSTSLTVVVTECQAEVITWFLNYAALKYVLESFHDYLQPGVVNPDPACPTVTAAKAVTLKVIQTAPHPLFQPRHQPT